MRRNAGGGATSARVTRWLEWLACSGSRREAALASDAGNGARPYCAVESNTHEEVVVVGDRGVKLHDELARPFQLSLLLVSVS